MVSSGVPGNEDGNFENNRLATEFGNVCPTICANAGSSMVIGIGDAALMKWSFWMAPKKNSLSLMIGPPIVPPYWLKRSAGWKHLEVSPDAQSVLFGSLRGSGTWLRKNSLASNLSLRP